MAEVVKKRKNFPQIVVAEKKLSVILAKSDQGYCAYCPELDLVTQLDTPEETLRDMVEAIRDYAEEYLKERELYANSPNRAHHLPYVQAVAACKTDWEVYSLLEVRYGYLQLR